jgi:tetratricopeptide (TPR) repeat protein
MIAYWCRPLAGLLAMTVVICICESVWNNRAIGNDSFVLVDDEATKSQLERSLADAERRVQKYPDVAEVYVERGMALFELGKVQDSLNDFDKAVSLRESIRPELWQRGIALYYLNRFDDAFAQFKTHHDVNPDDVENTAWYFLCLAKAKGLKEAQSDIVPSRGDARPPMMDVLKVYAGEITAEALVESIKNADAMTKFYGYLYVGLYYEAQGQSALAKEYVTKAVQTKRGGYMLRVAMIDLAARHESETPQKTK